MILAASILLVAPAVGPAHCQEAVQKPAQEPAPERAEVPAAPLTQPRGAAADAAAEPAKAQAAHAALEEEFDAAYQEWVQRVMAHRDSGAEGPYPDPPHAEFYARFAELARNGVVDARFWCLQNLRHSGLPEEEWSAHMRDEAMDLALHHADHPQIGTLAGRLAYGVGDRPGQLSLPVACGVLRLIELQAPDAEARATAMMSRATVLQRADRAGEARVLCQRVLDEHPETRAGKRAAGEMFKLEHLQKGMVAPDFSGSDVDGETLALSDYRGRVVLVDFWGFW